MEFSFNINVTIIVQVVKNIDLVDPIYYKIDDNLIIVTNWVKDVVTEVNSWVDSGNHYIVIESIVHWNWDQIKMIDEVGENNII